MKVLDIQTKVLKLDKTEFLLNKTFLSSAHDYWEQREKILLSWISRIRSEHEVNGDLAVFRVLQMRQSFNAGTGHTDESILNTGSPWQQNFDDDEHIDDADV